MSNGTVFHRKTIEEAMAAAHAQLGEDVTPEIVDLPARRLFKTIPARVRVVVEDEPAPQQEEPAPAPVQEEAAAPAEPEEETPAAEPAAEESAEEEPAAPAEAESEATARSWIWNRAPT